MYSIVSGLGRDRGYNTMYYDLHLKAKYQDEYAREGDAEINKTLKFTAPHATSNSCVVDIGISKKKESI